MRRIHFHPWLMTRTVEPCRRQAPIIVDPQNVEPVEVPRPAVRLPLVELEPNHLHARFEDHRVRDYRQISPFAQTGLGAADRAVGPGRHPR
jgi:hypothetical protein